MCEKRINKTKILVLLHVFPKRFRYNLRYNVMPSEYPEINI